MSRARKKQSYLIGETMHQRLTRIRTRKEPVFQLSESNETQNNNDLINSSGQVLRTVQPNLPYYSLTKLICPKDALLIKK